MASEAMAPAELAQELEKLATSRNVKVQRLTSPEAPTAAQPAAEARLTDTPEGRAGQALMGFFGMVAGGTGALVSAASGEPVSTLIAAGVAAWSAKKFVEAFEAEHAGEAEASAHMRQRLGETAQAPVTAGGKSALESAAHGRSYEVDGLAVTRGLVARAEPALATDAAFAPLNTPAAEPAMALAPGLGRRGVPA